MTLAKCEKTIAILTTVLVILLGISLIICTAHLYFTGGEQPYSRESVGKYLNILVIPSLITIAVAVAGLIIKAISGSQDDDKTKRTYSEQLKSYASRFDLSGIEGDTAETVRKEKTDRMIFSNIAYIFSAVVFVYVLAYLFFFADFSIENLNGDVINACIHTLPICAIAISIHVQRIYHAERSSKKALDAIREYAKEKPLPKLTKKDDCDKKVNPELIIRYAILAVAIVFIALGVFNGGMKDVLAKAVKICTECIGLG